MIKFTISRDALINPLQMVSGVVEKRQTLPVLSNVLFVVKDGFLSLTGTDLEVELVGKIALEGDVSDGEITIPAKRVVDIIKSLPDAAQITFAQGEDKIVVSSGRSRFTLSTLSSDDFPNVDDEPDLLSFEIKQSKLKQLIDATSFAMAQQDVRYYLNGMLLELTNEHIRTVSTDGHRLAMGTVKSDSEIVERKQVIVPRKGILELNRLLTKPDDMVTVYLSDRHIRLKTDPFTFTSKLVDGKFPDYERVLPKGGNKDVIGDRASLKTIFSRAAILANEKYRGVRINLSSGNIQVTANNPEQEEAEDNLTVDYQGEELEIGFNVSYLLDVLNAIQGEQVKFILSDTNSSALIHDFDTDESVYVVMPMRL